MVTVFPGDADAAGDDDGPTHGSGLFDQPVSLGRVWWALLYYKDKVTFLHSEELGGRNVRNWSNSYATTASQRGGCMFVLKRFVPVLPRNGVIPAIFCLLHTC